MMCTFVLSFALHFGNRTEYKHKDTDLRTAGQLIEALAQLNSDPSLGDPGFVKAEFVSLTQHKPFICGKGPGG